MYRPLREALERYRALAGQSLPLPLPQPEAGTLEAGQRYAGAGALRHLLSAYGDLPADTTPGPDGVYDRTLAAAVKRFQARNGLKADGMLAESTLTALNVPPAGRARQIELALERMRWLPALQEGPAIGISIPEFRLRAFVRDASLITTRFELDVEVAKALGTRCPVFAGPLDRLVFNPSWEVPPDVARKQIVPMLRRNPGYLAARHMELVTAAAGEPADAEPNAATLEAIRRGALKVRQRPGATNPLGAIKFGFANSADIYLHGAPSRRSRRDFSHGCIRVSDPMRLARFVFRDMPEWSEERIAEAMRAGTEKHVRLEQPIPVVIFYTTVIVAEDGTARFLPDLYGHDRTLDLAMQALYRR
jgi:murein L,D-transpeptidase YcbB/YkuD